MVRSPLSSQSCSFVVVHLFSWHVLVAFILASHPFVFLFAFILVFWFFSPWGVVGVVDAFDLIHLVYIYLRREHHQSCAYDIHIHAYTQTQHLSHTLMYVFLYKNMYLYVHTSTNGAQSVPGMHTFKCLFCWYWRRLAFLTTKLL